MSILLQSLEWSEILVILTDKLITLKVTKKHDHGRRLHQKNSNKYR